MSSKKEIKIIKEEVYKDEEGRLIKEKVFEIVSKVVIDDSLKNDHQKKYYETHKCELNEKSRIQKNQKYAMSEEFREKIRIRNRENYLKRKMKKEESKKDEKIAE